MLPGPIRALIVALLLAYTAVPLAHEVVGRLASGSVYAARDAWLVALVLLVVLAWTAGIGAMWTAGRTGATALHEGPSRRTASLTASVLRRAWWGGLMLLYAWFWWQDLRFAQFSVALALVPAGALAGVLVYGLCHAVLLWIRPPRLPSWTGARWSLAAGATAGLALLWGLMHVRSLHTGCVGMSDAYVVTQQATALALLAAPWVVGGSWGEGRRSRRYHS